MAVRIVVDTREPVLKKLLQDHLVEYYRKNGSIGNIRNIQNTGILIETESLDIGDVIIRFQNKPVKGDSIEMTDKKETVIVFERKTCADLAASVKDGRYKEQKARLLASGVMPQHIFYILEGIPDMKELLSTNFPIHGVKTSVISGMMIYTMLRDGIHMIPTSHTTETAAWIWAIALKCFSNPDKITGGYKISKQIESIEKAENKKQEEEKQEERKTEDAMEEEKEEKEETRENQQSKEMISANHYAQHIKVKKINNITPSLCFLMQLCQIPNISVTTATEIALKYPNMYALLTALSELTDTESRVKCLCDIPMIGKKKAETMLLYLLPNIHKMA